MMSWERGGEGEPKWECLKEEPFQVVKLALYYDFAVKLVSWSCVYQPS